MFRPSPISFNPTNFDSDLNGAAAASDIASIEQANGNGTIDGTALTFIDGTAAAAVQAIADIDSDPNDFDSDLNGVAAATDIAPIEAANGNGTIDGTALTDINGTTLKSLKLADLDSDPTDFNSTLSLELKTPRHLLLKQSMATAPLWHCTD